jgi:hypothetical protein
MRLTCWVVLMSFPAAMMAAETNMNAATLYGSGAVEVNKSAVTRTSAVYAGDRVATGKDGMATLSAETMTIVLPGESAILYQGKRLEMQYGRVLVTARPGAEVRLGNLTVSPAGDSANFRLQQNGAQLLLAALSGSLNVTDGITSAVLPAGQMMAHAAMGGDDQEPAPPGPKPMTHHRGIPGWVVGTITAGAVGGVVGGLAAAGAFSGATSNSKP